MPTISFTTLDGGREGLWDPAKWLIVLRLINKHKNSDIYDAENPLYSDLEAALPKETWRATEATGGFRPLFRDYAHPWARTDVASFDGQVSITPLGRSLLDGEINYTRLLLEFFSKFECESTHPFRQLIQGINDIPQSSFTTDSIAELFEVTSSSAKRRLRLALGLLEHAQIIAEVKGQPGEWIKFQLPTFNQLDEDCQLECIVDVFERASRTASLKFSQDIVLRFLSSIISKRFLILTGLSGSGKTKLAQAFSQWITPVPEADSSNSHVELVPVGADWTGNENILGYPNGLDDTGYITKPVLELIIHAQEHGGTPHFLILDEMNLSHVERYFADILSAIESGTEIALHCDEAREAASGVPRTIKLPDNLFIIGTVNVDETTYMFSPKVLDRANVIEFSMDPGDLDEFLDNPTRPDLSKLAGGGVGYGVAVANECKKVVDIPEGIKTHYKEEMKAFFDALQGEGAEYGFRVAHEAARFMYFYQVLGGHDAAKDDWFDDAFDAVIVQKFLPKLHGSSNKLIPLLESLWALCHKKPLEDEEAEGEDPPVDADPEVPLISIEAAKVACYKKSAIKIARMKKLLDSHGFASFAEA